MSYVLGRYDKYKKTITISYSKIHDTEAQAKEAARTKMYSRSSNQLVLLEIKGLIEPIPAPEVRIVALEK